MEEGRAQAAVASAGPGVGSEHRSGLYQFCGNTVEGEGERLLAIDRLVGAEARALLRELGIGGGWRCAEVGAGSGQFASWLAAQVCPGGQVAALDIDTSLLDCLGDKRVEVRCQDIVAEPLQRGAYDLVFSRAVLCHLRQRELALAHMIEGLRPGGFIVLHDVDIRVSTATCPPSPEFEAVVRAVVESLGTAGWDEDWSIRQPMALLAAGAREVKARTGVDFLRGGTAQMEFLRLSFLRMGSRIVGEDRVTTRQLEGALACCEDPSFTCVAPRTVLAWGRSPDVSGGRGSWM